MSYGSDMDLATPNLPSRDFGATAAFYKSLGFEEDWRDESWMILSRGDLTLEFFPHPDLDPMASWFSCCLRLDDVRAFYAICLSNGIPENDRGAPRLHKPVHQGDLLIGGLIDSDGTLLRLIQND